MEPLKILRYNNSSNRDFTKALTKRVNSYFKDKKISKFANGKMIFKTTFMLLLYIIPFVLMLINFTDNKWVFFGLEILIGLGMAGIGLSIMHDANHGAYSRNKRMNTLLANTINLVGGSALNWRIQHNVLHHSYTNVEGYDEDIKPPSFLRFSPKSEHRPIHRIQVLYAWFLYGLMTVMWSTTKDIKQLIRYNKMELIKTQNTTMKKELWKLILSKVIYFIISLGLPLLLTSYPVWMIVAGWFTMHFVCGLFLALVFQPAHVLESSEFYDPKENPEIDHSMMTHQLLTTTNFAHKNRILSWFIGGLNFQIEHHLFPNICHVHYRALSKIVKDTAQEFSLPYHEIKTFRGAIFAHFKMLHLLGAGK
jgi:linoleoyl-CoA desaturase